LIEPHRKRGDRIEAQGFFEGVSVMSRHAPAAALL
jgi:hypothetical protein